MDRFNLLASRRGRLSAFFFLYVCEGLPLGFATMAVTSELRREGVGPAAIGAFIAALLVPWSLKWLGGPIVDGVRSRRFGHRRAWILGCQLAMVATLAALSRISVSAQIGMATAIFVVHNLFAALQDVAIDGLAVSSIPNEERGLANALMYVGMMCGQALGGPAVLFLVGQGAFSRGYLLVASAVLLIMALVVLPLREPAPAAAARDVDVAEGQRDAWASVRNAALLTYQALAGSRGAFACLLFCLLPAGALSLNLSLKSVLAVELGFTPQQLAQLGFAGTLSAACGALAGGLLVQRVGTKQLIAVSTLAASIPTLWLMWQLQAHGHIMPSPTRQPASSDLAQALWVALIAYQFLASLMIGARFAVFMDVTNPSVGATQFATYAALNNVGLAMSASWQGKVAEIWGYPTVLAADVAIGALGLLVLPFVLRPSSDQIAHSDAKEPMRTRMLAGGLALACLCWVTVHQFMDLVPAARSLLSTPFTLAFTAASVFLLIRSAQDDKPLRQHIFRVTGLLLLLMHAKPYLAESISISGFDPRYVPWTHRILDAIPIIAGVVLLAAGRANGYVWSRGLLRFFGRSVAR